MKKILKAKLKKNPVSKESDDYYAQILDSKSFGLKEVIDELLKDNKQINAGLTLEIIQAFNRKVIELVASGNQVNTGLVNIYPSIKGLLNNQTWNPAVNRLEVVICQGIELGKMLMDTNILLHDEQGTEIELVDQSKTLMEMKLTAKNDANADNKTSKQNAEPPCGMAFRRWLCNS